MQGWLLVVHIECMMGAKSPQINNRSRENEILIQPYPLCDLCISERQNEAIIMPGPSKLFLTPWHPLGWNFLLLFWFWFWAWYEIRSSSDPMGVTAKWHLWWNMGFFQHHYLWRPLFRPCGLRSYFRMRVSDGTLRRVFQLISCFAMVWRKFVICFVSICGLNWHGLSESHVGSAAMCCWWGFFWRCKCRIHSCSTYNFANWRHWSLVSRIRRSPSTCTWSFWTRFLNGQ